MAFKSMTSQEYHDMIYHEPARKYRQLTGGIIVLEADAEKLCIGQRRTLSVAYRTISEKNKLLITEIKDPKKLEEIAMNCAAVSRCYG